MTVRTVTPPRLCGAVDLSPTPTQADTVPHDSFQTVERMPEIGDADHDEPPLDERSATTREVPKPAATHDVVDAHVIVNPSLNPSRRVLHDTPPLTVFSTA